MIAQTPPRSTRLAETLAIRTSGGALTPLLRKGTLLPASFSDIFSTASDNQGSVNVDLVAHEGVAATEVRSIASLEIDQLYRAPRGVPRVRISMRVDQDGALEVSAIDLQSGFGETSRHFGPLAIVTDEWAISKPSSSPSRNHEVRNRAIVSMRDLTGLSRIVIGSFVVIVVLSFLFLWYEHQTILLLSRAKETGLIDLHAAERIDSRQGMVQIVSVPCRAACVIVFLRWFYLTYRNLVEAGVRGLRFAAGWTILAWFFPFLNLIRPYQVMHEIWRVSSFLAHDEWRDTANKPWVGLWWACFLASAALNHVYLRFFLRTLEEVDDPELFVRASYLGLLAGASDIVAAVLAAVLVVKVTDLQIGAITRLREAELAKRAKLLRLPAEVVGGGSRLLQPTAQLSGCALVAGYLGLFAVLLVPGPFALVLGVLGIRDIRRNPGKYGRGRAWLGIVLGGVGTLALMLGLMSRFGS